MTEQDKRNQEMAEKIRAKAKELAQLIDEARKPNYNLIVTFHSGSQRITMKPSEVFGITSITGTTHY